MAMAGVPATPDSQYITLMSTASLPSFPKNTSSNFTTRFDPPLELRGGDFQIALTDIFYPTKWVNITEDDYRVVLEKVHKTRNFTPNRGNIRADEPYDPLDDPSDPEHRRRAAMADAPLDDPPAMADAPLDALSATTAPVTSSDPPSTPTTSVSSNPPVVRSRPKKPMAPTPIPRPPPRDRPAKKRGAKPLQTEGKKKKKKKAKTDLAPKAVQGEEKDEGEEEEEEVAVTPPSMYNNFRISTTHHQTWLMPAGYYASIDHVLRNLNQNVKKTFRNNTSAEKIPEMLSLDPVKGRVRLKLKPGVRLRFSPKLAALLGFKTRFHKGPTFRLAEQPYYLKRHLGSLHVYLNIMQERVVGDTTAPLIGMVPHVDTFPEGLHIANHTFLRPHYFPVKAKFIETVTCNIRDSDGDLISFDQGECTLTLHLVRASP